MLPRRSIATLTASLSSVSLAVPNGSAEEKPEVEEPRRCELLARRLVAGGAVGEGDVASSPLSSAGRGCFAERRVDLRLQRERVDGVSAKQASS